MSLIEQITNYFKGANEELRKVVWPSRTETIRSTIVVIGMSVAVGVFFYILDLIFNYALSFILK